MLLFSARILADFTHQMVAIRRLPVEVRRELNASRLAAPVHEDLGDERSVDLLLEWLCRAQDVGSDGRLSGGCDATHGWLPPAGFTTQLLAIRAFIGAADCTGNGMFRRRARRIAAAFIPEPGDFLPGKPLPADPVPSLLSGDSGSLRQQWLELRMLTAAQQLFGLGSYKCLLATSRRLMAHTASAADTAKAMTDDARSEDGAPVIAAQALFDLAWVTRDADLADSGLAILDQTLRRVAAISTASTGDQQRAYDPLGTMQELDTAARLDLCEALLDAYRLSSRNRLLHDAFDTLRPALSALFADLHTPSTESRRYHPQLGDLYTGRWRVVDLMRVVQCLDTLTTHRLLSRPYQELALYLRAVVRSSVLCAPSVDLHGSLPAMLPASGEHEAIVRSTESAAAFLVVHCAEKQQRMRQQTSLPTLLPEAELRAQS